MRVLDYFTIGFKTIIRQPLRSLLTVTALSISTCILVVLLAISIGAQKAVESGVGLTKSLTSVIVTPNQNSRPSLIGGSVQVANENATIIDQAALETLSTIPHVVAAQPMVSLWELKQFTVQDSSKTFVAQAGGTTKVDSLQIGRTFKDNEHEVVLGWSYARELGFTEATAHQLLNKTITFTTQNAYRGDGADIPTPKSTRQQHEQFAKTPTTITATIVGLTKPGVGDNHILLPLEWATKIKTVHTYNKQGVLEQVDQIKKTGYTNVVLQAETESYVKEIGTRVAQMGYGFTSAQEQLERITSLTTIMWGLFGAIAFVSLITACLGIANTMLTAISEQRYAIGVWRAVGARRWTISFQFIVQASILGGLGGIIGVAMGWLASRYISTYVAELLSQQGLPVMDIVHISPLLLCGCVVAALLFGTISGLYPAWRASRQDPSDALSAGQ